MTEEERREMMRSNYASQMEMLGYDASGNPLDMVHVVRCRYCKFGVLTKNRHGQDIVLCENPDFYTAIEHIALMPDWFCADGERRDDDATD